MAVQRNQNTVDSHWNYLWLELLLIWTELGVHAGALMCMCVCVCVSSTPPQGSGLYDFSIPVLTAAAGEEGFTALELFCTVFQD